jgi:hypothetical protein
MTTVKTRPTSGEAAAITPPAAEGSGEIRGYLGRKARKLEQVGSKETENLVCR